MPAAQTALLSYRLIHPMFRISHSHIIIRTYYKNLKYNTSPNKLIIHNHFAQNNVFPLAFPIIVNGTNILLDAPARAHKPSLTHPSPSMILCHYCPQNQSQIQFTLPHNPSAFQIKSQSSLTWPTQINLPLVSSSPFFLSLTPVFI